MMSYSRVGSPLLCRLLATAVDILLCCRSVLKLPYAANRPGS